MRFIAMLFLGLMLAASGVRAQAAAEGPVPMLDTGGHMGMITNIVFTPDGKQLVSAAQDKTIRVWDVATGKTVRTIHGEVSPGSTGMILGMALSPDGKWLAAAGDIGDNAKRGAYIRLYDFATGKLVALLKGHENVIYHLAFSPDSRHLISGSSDLTAIIWDVTARKAVHRLRGHQAPIYAVGFTPDGAQAVTGSYDRELRVWSVGNGALLQTMTGHGDSVRSLAIAADGRIASGDMSGEIRLWDGRTGAFLKTFAHHKTPVGSLSFSPDGNLLLSGDGAAPHECHVYDIASGREIVNYKNHDNVVIATAISPDGRWAVTGGGSNQEIHIWDLRTGEQSRLTSGQPLILGGSGRSVRAAGFSADGRRIAWGNSLGRNWEVNNFGPLEFALTLPSGDAPLTGPMSLLHPDAGASALRSSRGRGEVAFLRATTRQDYGWSLASRNTDKHITHSILDISLNGRKIASIERGTADGYIHRAYSFTPDGQTIISGGGNGVLSAYGLFGIKIGDFIGHEGDVWAVAPSPDGRYLVSGSSDQTVRLWNLNTRELLVTLFHGTDGEWVMWTPQGYYAASGPGAELIGWQINRGPENAADYVTAAQLRKSLNRPDIVTRAIQLASAEAAVKEANGTSFKLADLLAKPLPHLRIVSPAANATLIGGNTQVEIALEATPDPVKAIRIQINGRQVAEEMPKAGGGFKPGTLKFSVPLAKGRNIIRVVAVNDTGETPADITITHNGDGDLDKRGTLYILAIGVDKYPGLGNACRELDGKTVKSCDLRLAGADAKTFAETMAARLGPLHQNVVSRVLVNGGKDGEPTVANIADALGELRRAEPSDTVVMFIAGHGMNEGLNYDFLATEAAFSGGMLRNSTVVPWANFQVAIEGAKGRRILFLDTCHSGNSYNQRLTNDAYQANIVVYAAARWDQEALERGDLGHGLFTYAVVEGVNGAAKDRAGDVKAEGLRDFLQARVGELAKQLKREQQPQYFRGRDAENYVLAHGR